MSDLISRQAAIDALKEYFSDEDIIDIECGAYWHHKHVLDVLGKLPSAQPERKKGFWIIEDEFLGDCIDRCSMCGWMYSYNGFDDEREDYNYCPNCGAEMEQEERK